MGATVSRAYDEQIGERVKHIREVIAMSQSSVAARLGVTRQTLANYESGKTPMRADVVRLLCEVYEVPPAWVLGMTNDLHLRVNLGGRSIDLTEISPSIQSPGGGTHGQRSTSDDA